jgi:UPF0176 protein
VDAADKASPLYEEGVSCPACHSERSEEQRAGARERQKQQALAASRGEIHIGADMAALRGFGG